MKKASTKSKIKVVSKLSPEFSSNITVDNVTYHVQTEDMGEKIHKVTTRIYMQGKVVFSKESDYSRLTKLDDYTNKLTTIMEKQHKSAIDDFIAEQSVHQKLKSEYFEEVHQLIRRGNAKSALNALRNALDKFPLDPFFLSYHGYLLAIAENNTTEGIKLCKDAINKLNDSMPFGSEYFYPVFYLNLGRAYLKATNRNEAINAFKEGLKSNPDHRDILWELKKLGTRKKPAISFLKRSNPINKYLGKLSSKVSKKK